MKSQLKYNSGKWLLKILGPNRYLQLKYLYRTGKKLDLANPKRFTEKLQYLKLHDRRHIYTQYADKISVKQEVEKLIGKEYIIPTLKILSDVDQLKAEKLPEKPIIVKTNHDSGGSRAIINKSKHDFAELRSHIKKKLDRNFYYANLEWEYKNITPRILIEPLLSDKSGNQLLNDYKVHCFNGKPRYIQTILDRSEGVKETWYDTDWQYQNMWYYSPNSKKIKRPDKLGEMLKVAEELANLFPYVRVDLYATPDQLYFGECTFRPYGGFMRWNDERWDNNLGELIDLKQ